VHPLDMRANPAQLLDNSFVPAVDVIDAVDNGLAVRHQHHIAFSYYVILAEGPSLRASFMAIIAI